MPFDIEGAKKSGYSEKEIADHLAQTRGFDADGARKSGYSDAEIIDHLSVKELSWSDVPGEALRNIPSSAAQLGRDVAYPFMHPVQTAKGLYGVASGGVQKLIPGEQDNEAKWDAFTQALSDRYGGEEQIKRTLATDPVGSAADVAGLLTGGGAALKAASKVGPLSKLGRVGSIVSSVGAAIDPVNIAKLPFKAVASQPVARRLYSSALKPSTTLRRTQRNNLIDTAIEKAILPTPKGLAKLDRGIRRVDDQISSIIDSAATRGDTIRTADILGNLEEMRKAAPEHADPTGFIAAIDNASEKFAAHGPEINVGMAQKIKQNIYKELKSRYEAAQKTGTAADPMSTAASKELARGIKDQLNEMYPELKALNADDAAMLNLRKEVERAAGRIQNSELFGLSPYLAATVAGSVSQDFSVASGAFLLAMAVGSPRVKSSLAIALSKARKYGKRGPILDAITAQEGRAGQLENEMQQSQ